MKKYSKEADCPQKDHPQVFHSDTGEARASIRLYGLGEENIRVQGRLSSTAPLRRLHEISTDNSLGPSSLSIRHVLRGDGPVADHSVRIFRWSEDIQGTSALFVPGLNPLNLEADADEYYNQKVPRPFVPLTIVKALTVDGAGGSLDLESAFPRPCFWYYVENEFVCNPQAVDLERIKIRRPNGNERMLEDNVLRIQRENLTNWFLQVYGTDRMNAPTRRPITENYYAQIKASTLTRVEKNSLGVQIFGERIFEVLEARRNQILDAVKRRRRN